MSHLHTGGAITLLGYPADARLLIINADDFGLSHAINAAQLQTAAAGLARELNRAYNRSSRRLKVTRRVLQSAEGRLPRAIDRQLSIQLTH